MTRLTMAPPQLDWTEELEHWLEPFMNALGPGRRWRTCPAYVAGLIDPGDRKSVQPMAARDNGVNYDRLHHFICSSVWAAAPLESALLVEADKLVGGENAWLIVDDTAWPKKGRSSVGVAPQYWQDRQLSVAGFGDSGLARGAGNGWSSVVFARELDR